MTKDKTVTMSRELAQFALNAVEYLALRADDIGYSNEPVADALRAVLAAPVVERQEPVALLDVVREAMEGCYRDGRGDYRCSKNERIEETLQAIRNNTSPPAPVAVVLPERKCISNRYTVYNPAIEWNACLDKVKELNQSPAPGFTAVDVATADADGFQSGRKSVGLLLAPAFRTIEQKGGKYSVKLAFEDSAEAWAAYEEIERSVALAAKE